MRGQWHAGVVTRGTSLSPLVGRRFRIGGVECMGRRLAEPCAHLERVSGAGLLRPLAETLVAVPPIGGLPSVDSCDLRGEGSSLGFT